MTGSKMRRLACATVLTATALFGGAGAASAASPQVTEIDLPAGLGCSFPLHIVSVGGQEFREIKDKHGEIRLLQAGKGAALTLTNVDTSASLSLRPNGSVAHVTLHADGSSTWVITGHNVLILFPTDSPPGPSTTLHVGRVVFTSDANANFTVVSVSGRSTDLCAALSG